MSDHSFRTNATHRFWCCSWEWIADVYRRAPQLAQLRHEDESVSSLVDVDSPHISSVPSDYDEQSVKTDTQAQRERREQEAEEMKEEAKQKAEELKKQASAKKEQAKNKASNAGQTVKENSDNPVFIGNAVAIAAVGGLLGFGAYQKYTAGQLTWKIAGLWAGAVGLFGVADYYVSQYVSWIGYMKGMS